MRLWAWGQSDPGRKRERNEDSYLVDPETGVMAVADGMGGHQGGATASRMAVEFLGKELAEARGDFAAAFEQQLKGSMRTTEEMPAVDDIMDSGFAPTSPRKLASMATPLPDQLRGDEPTAPGNSVLAFSPALELMRGIVRRASSAIFEAAWAKPELRGMGTTLTAALVHGGRAHLVHAGDSRCYMFRDGQLRQLSDDHSWIAEQLRSGSISEAEAKHSKFRHVITKSIGFERDIEADMKSVPVTPGDCFLLCSDGMSNYVEHGELERIVAMTWYRRLPETLIELANSRGGDDNITVVVGLVANTPPPPP
ncbi:MAG: serine/threonine-protein phosphatase [Deltaproteobacteria bacterium]|nr:serine/threonine-protein phosphatase [Deltaproteobacteria bacterium]MDQ3300184.1 protein phosphatase 2C domain-containing protein [Myxococcota bacterium]